MTEKMKKKPGMAHFLTTTIVKRLLNRFRFYRISPDQKVWPCRAHFVVCSNCMSKRLDP